MDLTGQQVALLLSANVPMVVVVVVCDGALYRVYACDEDCL